MDAMHFSSSGTPGRFSHSRSDMAALHLALPFACPAHPTLPTMLSRQSGVLRAELVAVLAMRTRCALCSYSPECLSTDRRGGSSSGVLRMGDRLQMGRVAAGAIAA